MEERKSFPVTKGIVWEAYKKVKRNRGSAGIDRVSIEDFDKNLSNNLYKIWNRLASGSYFPPGVKQVEIPKKDGKVRKLGIPTVGDRVAQTVVKTYLEEKVDQMFHPYSYGYRPCKSAHDALQQARKNCWEYAWVIDMDIKGFFDNIDHELVMKALDAVTGAKWVKMYCLRWMEARVETKEGLINKEGKGTPQGGVISPLLANLFLHFAFDQWMVKNYAAIRFERYADDIIVHCQTKEQAEQMLTSIRERMQECKLELHEEKTKIVYCKDYRRREKFTNVSFDFLGFTFKPRTTMNKSQNKLFQGFDLAISKTSRKKIVGEINKLGFHKWTGHDLSDIAKVLNPKIRGWLNYFGKFRRYELAGVFMRLNFRILKWSRKKFKRLRYSKRANYNWLKRVCHFYPNLFVHWAVGFKF
jgi:group II intron reverse transcriptase/maturase